ncbi:MAG: amidohydrolase [Planctomycetota bacterium]|jgi:predicted amidohydrolase YtcJ
MGPLSVVPAAVLGLGRRLFGAPRRTLYIGGPILTMDPEDRIVEALGVEGDRIAAVGSGAELEAWADGSARVVDLVGRALLPGFIDAHGHFPGTGIFAVQVNLNSPPVGDVETMADLLARLRERARETRSGRWIVGWGYDDTLLAEKRHPTRDVLDAVSQEHPIVLWHVSGHLAAANGLALERVGISADTPDPEGGRIRRDLRSGEPDGVLEENASDPLQGGSRPSFLGALRIVRAGSALYLRAGVTTVQSGYTLERYMRGLTWLSRLGVVAPRLVLWPGDELAQRMLDGSFSYTSYDERWVRLGAAKLLADGSIQGYTGYLSQPYHVPPGDDPAYRGYPRIPREELIEKVARRHAAGWQVAVHGNGDAAIDDILDAFENAQRQHPRSDARHVVIHAQMAREDQLDRMKALGVIPSFFSLHTYYWGDRHREVFMGPERAARMSPARSALDRGLRFTLHCDSPVVPMEPLRLVWAAVNRRSTSGVSIGDAQRIPPLAALRAVTIDAAWQHFEEHEKGSLEPGKLADLVILSESPLEHPDRIDRIRVLETILGGRVVYRARDS